MSHRELGTDPLDAGGRGAEVETDPPAERACQELGELSVEPGEELVGELDDDGGRAELLQHDGCLDADVAAADDDRALGERQVGS